MLSMTKLFINEISELMQDYEAIQEMAEQNNCFSVDEMNELFQITHTIKGDATMMLYEGIARPVKAFEQVLSAYRDTKSCGPYPEIAGKLKILTGFISGELKQIEEEQELIHTGEAEAEEICPTQNRSVPELSPEEKDSKQRFYIAPEGQATPYAGFLPEASEQKVSNTIRKRSITVSEDELAALQRIVMQLTALDREQSEGGGQNAVLNDCRERSLHLELKDWFYSVSMEPLSHLTAKLRRVVEEMCVSLSKEIELTITGGDVLIERSRMQAISGVLLHLLRNCADHGIEAPMIRRAKGKPETGRIHVKYRMTDDRKGVIIEVSDDGTGLNEAAIQKKAVSMGLLQKEEVPEQKKLWEMIFCPGFSTAKAEGEYSGMGVGLDVVKSTIDSFHGSVTVLSKPENGVRFITQFNYVFYQEEREETVTNENIDSRR